MRTGRIFFRFGLPALLVLGIAVGLLVQNANKILRYELERFLGKGFSVESIELHWGSVEAKKIRLEASGGKRKFNADRLLLRADFLSIIGKQIVISDLVVESPYIYIELDEKGNLVHPLSGKFRGKEKPAGAATPILIKKLNIHNGSVDFLDRKVASPPVLTKVRDIRFNAQNLAFPIDDRRSDYLLTLSIPYGAGKGTLKSNGWINLMTKDTKGRLDIRDVDLVGRKPYYTKKSDVDVTKGTVSLGADINVARALLHSSGKVVLKDLEFRSGGSSTFLGVPQMAVVSLLRNNNNEIALDFVLEGDINNPKFNIRESLIRNMTLSLSKAMGVPIENMGKSVFELGGSALKGLFGR